MEMRGKVFWKPGGSMCGANTCGINFVKELEQIEAEGTGKYSTEERKALSDVGYLSLKCGRHLLNIWLGIWIDKDSGVHEMSKVLWYILRLCHIFGVKIKVSE